jgi:hypothetical protein
VARSWGQAGFVTLLVVVAIPLRGIGGGGLGAGEAIAGAVSPLDPKPPFDPGASSVAVHQRASTHVFDTESLPGPLHYVNDHTLIQGPDRRWHLYGIYHREPIGEDSEFDFVHAIASEPDPARWGEGAFEPAPAPHTIALHADRAIGETHIWAPHVVADGNRYWMIYQGGGTDGDRASIRLAESDDLYRWTRVSDVPLFEDVCVARDPMLTRRESLWALYYTRCDSVGRRISGVAYRLSRDLAHWSEPRMVLSLPGTPPMPNSGFTESPFVFEKDGYHYLSVSPYPLAWDATLLYRSPAPFAFPSEPYTRLRAHAAEWLSSADGRTMFMTHAGPGQRGVWMSPVDL